MAAKTALLLVSLLSLCATTTLATIVSPLTIPSCCPQYNPQKCYADYKAAYMAKMGGEIKAGAAALPIALNAITAAKTSCAAALQFFNAMKGIGMNMPVSCQNTFSIAVNHLGKASGMMQGKTNLSPSTMAEVQKSCQIAAQNVLKCTSTDKNPALKTIVDQPVMLCNVALSFSKQITISH